MATTQSVYRLSPGRTLPSRSGDGLPTATKIVLLALSEAGVIHTPPPPVFQASANLALSPFSLVTSRWRSAPSAVLVGQVPNQPLGALSSKVESPLGAGIEYQRHTGSPVMAL